MVFYLLMKIDFMMKKNNPYSHLTAIERQRLSFPATFLKREGLLAGEILDMGCGVGKDVEILSKENFNIVGYDPYYFPQYPEKKFDTIMCFYVLNVLLPEEQINVLMNVSEKLKDKGKAYFAVRRDIKFSGYRTHRKHNVKTYQCNVILPFKSLLKNDFCEIYEYQHYTLLNKGKKGVSPFFADNENRELIVESATVFSFFDKFPVSKGHSLIVPKRKVSNFFELSLKEQIACWLVLARVKEILQERFKPQGFNVGINVGEVAGQTISHAHIHVIPRYTNDVENPRGGVRGVIPSKKDY